jgi:hypothetical protein
VPQPAASKQKLNQKFLLERMLRHTPDLPAPVVKAGFDCIMQSMQAALAVGRVVTLRCFGSFWPRHYDSPGIKKFGLLFHPSSLLVDRLSKGDQRRPPSRKTIPSSDQVV